MKGAWEVWNRTYIGSFSFGDAENMAMWGLYGLPWEDAVRIAIPKREMLKWIENIRDVYLWENGTRRECVSDFKISLTDIVYVNGHKNDMDLRLTHADKNTTIAKPPRFVLTNAPDCFSSIIKPIASNLSII